MTITDHKRRIIDGLPAQRKEFMERQTKAFSGWMYGDYFMPNNGYCYHCKADIITHQISKGNNGSMGVTGCHACFKSYCE